jgi:lantibiotic biosynthesis protein
MNTITAAGKKLAEIEQQLFDTCLDNTPLSLFNGKGGLLLLYHNLYTVLGDDDYSRKSQLITEQLMDDITKGIPSFTYCDGLTGIAALFSYLREKEFFDSSIDGLLEQCDQVLHNALQVTLDNANWDYLHGAIGMILYFIERNKTGRDTTALEPMIEKVVQGQLEQGREYTNCGMAHGLVSLLMLLIKYARIAADPANIRSNIKAIAEKLLAFRSPDPGSLSVFPSIVKPAEPGEWNYEVPLGWCYGDTTISIGLYHAGKTLHSPYLVKEATELALHTTRRVNRQDSRVFDAGFCHGSASVAHIYRKWYQYTLDPVFLDSYHSWIDQTIAMCSFEDGIGGYKKFTGKTYSPECGVLSGAAGVALVLSDFIGNGPSDWDRFFLLS